VIPLDCGQEFDAAHEDDFFAAIPSRPGVFMLELHGGEGVPARPFLSRSADLRRATERLLRVPEAASKRLNLREVTRRIRYRVTGSAFEQALVLYQQARELFPQRYRALLRLRPPALLKVNLRNDYPRCYVTRRIVPDGGFYVGPFPSRRAAEFFSGEFLNLFKVRRCQIKIRRDPSFPGCIYSEMKMCLAPCFAGCSKEEYDAEAERLVEALATGGGSLTAGLEKERDAASEALEFERAAAVQKRLDKVKGILRGLPEAVRRVDELDAIILQKTTERNGVAAFAVRAGMISESLILRFDELKSQPRSIEAILREYLEGGGDVAPSAGTGESVLPLTDPAGTAAGEPPIGGETYRARYAFHSAHETLPDHLVLFARWFYSKPREGEIFFRERSWPYRRMARACSRLLEVAQSPSGGLAPTGA
jgi:excinuclease ABC subunit C